MSDGDLEIRHGGVVAVDTETLRAVTRRLESLATRVAEASTQLAAAMARAADDARWDSLAVPAIVRGSGEVTDTCRSMAADLGRMADVYEYVELRAMADLALRSSDAPAWAGYREQMRELRERAGGVGAQAWAAEMQRASAWDDDFLGQGPLAGFAANPLWGSSLGVGAASLIGGLAMIGRGTVGREERLAGAAPAVTVRPVPSSVSTVRPLAGESRPKPGTHTAPAASTAPASTVPGVTVAGVTAPASTARAPAGLAAAMSRIPRGDAQVRVETYTMANGSKQYAVYIAGTRTPSFGAKDPFDLTSNVQLYSGQRSASYEAVREALHQSGADRGDTVHAFGHSQGAMIGGRVALEGEFEVKTLGTAGPPIEADVSDATLSVALRHTDDPVAMLSGGGTVHGPGSPDSFIAERLADPAPGIHDVDLGVAHGLDVYVETAQMVDASNDPRVQSLREVFTDLDQAVSVEVTEYVAERPDSSRAGDEG